MKTVAVLFARADSVYKTLPGVDVWDEARDARNWPGGCPVVAHPPCRAWGELSHFAKPAPHEKDLARWAVRQVREWGGVLEHPRKSKLWADQGLSTDTTPDEYGGWTLTISQHWWGHRAEKLTRLYIVGCDPKDIPTVPIVLGEATHKVTNGGSHPRKGQPGYRPECTKAEREHTPPELAAWLVELARRCSVRQMEIAA